MIDAHASQVSHARHLLPVWSALPDDTRGTFTAAPVVASWLDARDVDVVPARLPDDTDTPIVVASFADVNDSRGRPIALVEHGAGQTYRGYDSGGYAGGPGRDAVSLFLCPSQRVADLNAARYPTAVSVDVGPPALDGRWDSYVPDFEALAHDAPIVGLSFHWAADFPVPEGRPAWPHYVKQLAAISGALGGRVLGHGHPRAIDFYRRRYLEAGIDVVDDFDELCERVDVYAVDISSTGFEAAARGMPVVWLHAPWYRDDAGHGLRWGPEASGVGWRCDSPDELPAVARRAFAESEHPSNQAARRAALASVYGWRDDDAARRCARTLVEWERTAVPTSTRPRRRGRSQ